MRHFAYEVSSSLGFTKPWFPSRNEAILNAEWARISCSIGLCPSFDVMSGLFDMWTAEMAKLREKGQALWSNETGSSNGGSVEAVAVLEKGGNGNSTRPGSIFGRFGRVNSAVALCSEASVSMIVECVSP